MIKFLRQIILGLFLFCMQVQAFGWGFYGHKKINYVAVFLLPPEMIGFYKTHIDFITEHAVDPDMRRYAVKEEAPRHYLDIDHYGSYPYTSLPRKWTEAVAKFSEDSLQAYGIVPWWVQTMQRRLTEAFKEKNQAKILKLSAEIGHYISDAHVPLHASHNHNGQFSNQVGIHAFWESRIPELFADKQYDFFIGKASYIANPGEFIWARVLESGAAADTVLKMEAELSRLLPADAKFSFEERLGKVSRQYSTAFSAQYQERVNGMIERRMRQSIYAVASFWYTAWVDAGQPDLKKLVNPNFTADDLKEFENLNAQWTKGKALGKICD
jgi:S1/P1 Nuclease